jgi:chromosome segregation ATPase
MNLELSLMSSSRVAHKENRQDTEERIQELRRRLSVLQEELEIWEGQRREAHREVKRLTREIQTTRALTTRLEKHRDHPDPLPW